MTPTEEKALALVNKVAATRGTSWPCVDRKNDSRWEALCRALEQHEAFRQEVSDAVEDLRREWPEVRSHIVSRLSVFIIAKPVDPLVEACRETHGKGYHETEADFAADLRAALAARGLKIVEDKADA